MFDNIGKKIKTMSQVIISIGIITSVITGIVIIAISGTNVPMSLLGLAIMILGSIISWVSSFILYGFGQLIENSDKLVQTHGINIKDQDIKVDSPTIQIDDSYEKLVILNKLREKGLITEEEENQFKKHRL